MVMDSAPLVLLVEDDPDVQEATRDVLEGAGYTVEVSSDGGRALMRLAERPSPALILLDWMMPVLDGAAFLREFEARVDLPQVAIVLLTAVPPRVFATHEVRRPVLHKPFDLEEFLDTVARHTRCPPQAAEAP